MDAAKAKELKKYTRELLRDHETLSRNLAAAEALAAERQAELDKLQAQAERAPRPAGTTTSSASSAALARARRGPREPPAPQRVRVRRRARHGAGGGGARAESANRRVDDERRRLLEALEAAADAARRAHRGAAYRNGDGASLVEAVEARSGTASRGRRAPLRKRRAAPRRSVRAADAVTALEAAGVAFQLRHARHAVERLRDAAAPAAAAAEAPEVDDEAAPTATGRASRPGPRVRAVRAHGPVAHGVQRRAAAGGVAVTARARGAAALRADAARRRRCRRAWRSVEIDGVGAWVSTALAVEEPKLAWAFEAADDGSSLFRPSSLSPPASPSRRRTTTTTAPRTAARRPRRHRRRRGVGRYDVATGPEVWAAADAVAGADRALGPVRERWAVVRGDAAVFLTCRLKRQRRPLLRTRTARFRVAAMDARRFHDVALAKAAATANAAGWALAELRDDPPDDAASHAPLRTADAASFGDLEEAVRRVFGDDGAPHFVF
ncbi:ATPase [Aureococcus anophagefferens]|nr:ATPase [Aureococcus anophagefferens]